MEEAKSPTELQIAEAQIEVQTKVILRQIIELKEAREKIKELEKQVEYLHEALTDPDIH